MATTNKTFEAALTEARKSGRDIWKTDVTGTRVGWVLQLRASQSGIGRWYFRYTDGNSKRQLISLGLFSEMSLAEARSKANDMGKLYKQDPNLKELLREQTQDRDDARRQRQVLKAEEERRRQSLESATVGALMDVYVEDLLRQGKQDSAKDARSVFSNHAREIRALPVTQLTRQDITNVLRNVIDNGKGRTAGILRSYLGAAFQRALDAEDDASIHKSFLPFRQAGLERNPAAETKALTKYQKPRERFLTEIEFRRMWARLNGDDYCGFVLKCAIALGGQRIAQLLRTTVNDIGDDGIITLRDGKGRRSAPRQHHIPLAGLAETLIPIALETAKSKGSAWLFTMSGRKPMHPDTLTHWVTDLSRTMLQAGDVDEPFQLKDIRRTVETTLSRLDVRKEHRAQLQSHGLSGVQNRHYDRHDYLQEKKAALIALTNWILSSEAGNPY
jgi:integrase